MSEEMKKKFIFLQRALIVCLCIYFVSYVLGTSLYDGPGVNILQTVFTVIAAMFTLAGLMLFWYTIMMLRQSIE